MGLISTLLATLFGGDRNAVRDVAEIFRVNAEAASQRGHALDGDVLTQFAAEFAARSQRTWWDSLIDGLNRLPRPSLVLGVFAVLIWSVADPVFMAEVFTAWAIIPAPVWALIMVIVTFYFGGRQQVKAHDFQRELAGQVARTQMVLGQRAALQDMARDPAPVPDPADPGLPTQDDNPALDAWMASS